MKQSDPIVSSRVAGRVAAGGFIVVSLFVLSVFLWLLPGIEESMLQERQDRMKEESGLAWSVLNHFHDRAVRNAMPVDEAMKVAADAVGGLRYGPDMKDVFWITDLHPTMIVHPYRKKLEGQDLASHRDAAGKADFVEFVRICRENGEGLVKYSGQKRDDQTQAVPHLGYVRLFKPWNWVIGTGLPLDEIQDEMRAWKSRVLTVCLLLALGGLVLSWGMSREVARVIRNLAAARVAAAAGTPGRRAGLTSSLQTFILLIMVPTLVGFTAVWCAVFYHDLRPVIMSGFDRKLVAVSSTTGCFIRGEDHAELARQTNETLALYVQYVQPMKRIMREADLTYLYTQTLSDEKPFCHYILDATEGDDHSTIGSRDELPLVTYQGAEKVLTYGIIHVGEVQPTENWGMIKSSFAPIYNADDSISAMAGADVNVGVIDDKLRAALFIVGLAGAAALLLAGLVSLFIARQLTRPIERLKAAALLMAAGSYGRRVEIRSPSELRAMAHGISGISEVLRETLKDLTQTNETMEARKRRYDLTVALDKSDRGSLSFDSERCAFGWLNSAAEARTASGWAVRQDKMIFWIARGINEPLDAVKFRNDMALAADCLLRMFGDDPDSLCAELDILLTDDIRCFGIRDAARPGLVRCLARTDVKAAFVDEGGHAEETPIPAAGELQIPAGYSLVIWDSEKTIISAFSTPPVQKADVPGSGVSVGALRAILGDEVERIEPGRQIMVGVVGG